MNVDTIALIIWVVIAILLIWPLTVIQIHYHDKKHPHLGIDGMDWTLATAMSTCVASLWPIALAPLLSYLIWRKVDRTIFQPRKRSPKP